MSISLAPCYLKISYILPFLLSSLNCELAEGRHMKLFSESFTSSWALSKCPESDEGTEAAGRIWPPWASFNPVHMRKAWVKIAAHMSASHTPGCLALSSPGASLPRQAQLHANAGPGPGPRKCIAQSGWLGFYQVNKELLPSLKIHFENIFSNF